MIKKRGAKLLFFCLIQGNKIHRKYSIDWNFYELRNSTTRVYSVKYSHCRVSNLQIHKLNLTNLVKFVRLSL